MRLRAAAAAESDSEAVRDAIARFNDQHQRAAVLSRDADIARLDRLAGQEVSQVYFEARAIRLLTPDVAVVDAIGSQYGTTLLKRTIPAIFVLKREEGAWRIAVLRLSLPVASNTAHL